MVKGCFHNVAPVSIDYGILLSDCVLFGTKGVFVVSWDLGFLLCTQRELCLPVVSDRTKDREGPTL